MLVMDTEKTPPRAPINFRLRPAAIERLDVTAHKHSLPGAHVTRSDVIKAALAVAFAHPEEFDKTIQHARDQI